MWYLSRLVRSYCGIAECPFQPMELWSMDKSARILKWQQDWRYYGYFVFNGDMIWQCLVVPKIKLSVYMFESIEQQQAENRILIFWGHPQNIKRLNYKDVKDSNLCLVFSRCYVLLNKCRAFSGSSCVTNFIVVTVVDFSSYDLPNIIFNKQHKRSQFIKLGGIFP